MLTALCLSLKPIKMGEKTVYVGISNKSEVRRELLECSKDIVGILKNYDMLNSIREEKVEKIEIRH